MSVSDSPGDSAEEDDSEKDDEESEEEDDEDDSRDEGMEILLKEGDHSPSSSGSRPKKEISHIAATAESLQPKGYTLATTKVFIYSSIILYYNYNIWIKTLFWCWTTYNIYIFLSFLIKGKDSHPVPASWHAT